MYYGQYITAIHYLRHSLFNKLDLDTCSTPEATNWTDLNCRALLSVLDGSGPKIESSGPTLNNELIPLPYDRKICLQKWPNYAAMRGLSK